MKCAVGASFVLPHDADPFEADLLVSTDGASVVGGRVYRDAVMSALLEEEVAYQTYRFGPEAPTLVLRGEKEIDTRMPVVAMQLLPSCDPADRLAVRRDDEGRDALCAIDIIPGEKLVPVEIVIGLAPMASDFGLAKDLQKAWKILLFYWTKDDA